LWAELIEDKIVVGKVVKWRNLKQKQVNAGGILPKGEPL
jgi:hypothetical protein